MLTTGCMLVTGDVCVGILARSSEPMVGVVQYSVFLPSDAPFEGVSLQTVAAGLGWSKGGAFAPGLRCVAEGYLIDECSVPSTQFSGSTIMIYGD